MNYVKVIGIGSPFGKDQLGWNVIEALKNTSPYEDIEYIIADRPGIKLLDLIKGADYVILIDAVNEASRAGEIVQLTRTDLINTCGVFSSHAVGVSDTLALGTILGLTPDNITLFGICIDPNHPEPIPKTLLLRFHQTITGFINMLLDSNTIPIFDHGAMLNGY